MGEAALDAGDSHHHEDRQTGDALITRTQSAGARAASRGRLVAWWATAAAVFIFSWLLRYNDPGGSFGGLTDDHFFYLVRGWQILFGELPVRDFVDHGAPLFYYVGAAVQLLLGRGTWSEIVFTVTVLSLCASITWWLASRASGSILLGLLGVLFQILLEPRFYNYPKLLAYALAIPALWAFADRPGARQRFLLAIVTVIAFLFRHDHGVYIGVAVMVLLLAMTGHGWRERTRHALAYAAQVLLLLLPYLVFIQINGGVVSYFQSAAAWAERDRVRAPLVWPPLWGNPDGDLVAWIFYALVALPLVSLAVIAASRDAFRPDWPHARAKLITVAVLGIVLNAGFLRHPIEGRLADPSVPHAILLAWLAGALIRMIRTRDSWRPALRPLARPLSAGVALAMLPILVVVVLTADARAYDRLDKAALLEGPSRALRRAGEVTRAMQRIWPLENWSDRDAPGVMRLTFYLRDCTTPQDRVFMGPYLPQAIALARRGFAGGHADLRRGFFDTPEEQQLTIERLRQQSVPVVIMGAEEYEGFRESFPLVTAYFDEHYAPAGTRDLDDRFSVLLLARRDRRPSGTYTPLDWPCFR